MKPTSIIHEYREAVGALKYYIAVMHRGPAEWRAELPATWTGYIWLFHGWRSEITFDGLAHGMMAR